VGLGDDFGFGGEVVSYESNRIDRCGGLGRRPELPR
jgi:hypothetical protein